jgi:hypothetical protein
MSWKYMSQIKSLWHIGSNDMRLSNIERERWTKVWIWYILIIYKSMHMYHGIINKWYGLSITNNPFQLSCIQDLWDIDQCMMPESLRYFSCYISRTNQTGHDNHRKNIRIFAEKVLSDFKKYPSQSTHIITSHYIS